MIASGQIAVIASGRPGSPSQHTIRASLRPRLRSSVNTFSQNFAPSPPLQPDPQHVFEAIDVDPHH